jgi:hypothetical protein
MCAKVTAMTVRILLTANEQFPIARDWLAIDDDVLYERFFCGCFGVDASVYGSSPPFGDHKFPKIENSCVRY